MFGWLKRWLGWESDWEVYRPDERLVYSYHNGERMVRADPLMLYPRLMDCWTDLRHWIVVLDAVDNFGKSKLLDPEIARQKVSEYTRKIFNLKPLKDGIEAEGTLTDEQAFRLLNHFLIYAEWIKKKSEPFADAILEFGGLDRFYRGRITYRQFVGLWLCRQRAMYRRAYAVALGTGIANGSIDPGIGYFRAITDGEQRAKVLTAQHQLTKMKG